MERAGFAIRDVLVGVIVLGTLGALAVPTLSQVRMDSGRQACNGNYRFIIGVSSSYENDHAGYMWALSWRAGMMNPLVPWTAYFSSDNEAQGYQAVSILRRLANLTPEQSPVPANWVSQISYTHVALMDYVNLPIPASYLVCPEDSIRQRYVEGDFSHLPPNSGDGSLLNWRTPYSSSYTASTFQWGPSRQTAVPQYLGAPNGPFVPAPMWFPSSSDYSLWTFNGYSSAPNVNGPKQSSDVRFPSNKVFMSDDYARHQGKPRFFAYHTAGQDLLFYDGSVRYCRTDSTNPGWNPSSASNRGNMLRRFSFTKKADFWGGLDNGATQTTFQAGWYRWTRGGLFGWDVPRLSSMVGKLPSASVIENEVDTSAATGAW